MLKIHGYNSRGERHYLHIAYYNIVQRCTNPKNKKYKLYGEKGIKCLFNNFLDFKKYIENNLGERPSLLHSLDRKNTNGNYEPGNLRWATDSEQTLNTNLHKSKTSKYRGVSWDKSRSKWVAYIGKDGKTIPLGRFNVQEEAAEAFLAAYYGKWKCFPPEYKPILFQGGISCA